MKNRNKGNSHTKANHNKHTHTIMNNPRAFFDLGELVLSCDETNLFKNDTLKSQPDNLIFDSANHKLYNIEYKGSSRQRNHAVYQLRARYNLLSQVFPEWDIKNLYVHSDYRMEEIKW